VILLQIAIQLFMGVSYLAFLIANIVWVDWAAFAAAAQRAIDRRRRIPKEAYAPGT